MRKRRSLQRGGPEALADPEHALPMGVVLVRTEAPTIGGEVREAIMSVFRERLFNALTGGGGRMSVLKVDGGELSVVSDGQQVMAVWQTRAGIRCFTQPEVNYKGCNGLKSVDDKGRVGVSSVIGDMKLEYVLYRRDAVSLDDVSGVLLDKYVNPDFVGEGFEIVQIRPDSSGRILLSAVFPNNGFKEGGLQMNFEGHEHCISFNVDGRGEGLSPAELQNLDFAWMVS